VTSQTTASPLQVCRDCGGGAPVDAHFCPQCTKILTISRHGDYFRFLGLPRKLHIGANDLDQRFRGLSRQFHPDYFVNAAPAERRASLERSSYLNDAYRTLKDPIARTQYLLSLEGVQLEEQSKAATDKAEQESAGYRAVSVVPILKQHHAVAMVTLVKGTQFKSMSEPLE